VQAVKILLQHGASYITPSYAEITSLLHMACQIGCASIVDVLLNSGINSDRPDIDYTNLDKRTPLHVASIKDHVACVEVLLKNGANINALDLNQMTPLHYACANGYKSVMHALLKKVEQIQDKSKLSPKESITCADINARNKYGCTPLFFAIEFAHEDMVMALIENGADPNISNINGESPLMLAIRKKQTAIAKFLLQNCAVSTAPFPNSAILLQLLNQNCSIKL